MCFAMPAPPPLASTAGHLPDARWHHSYAVVVLGIGLSAAASPWLSPSALPDRQRPDHRRAAGDLNRCGTRSRRTRWCKFTARLLSPLCRRCSVPGSTRRAAGDRLTEVLDLLVQEVDVAQVEREQQAVVVGQAPAARLRELVALAALAAPAALGQRTDRREAAMLS